MSPAPKLKSRYEIKDRLPKQGAMGVVYRAWDLEMKRFVVIKTIGDARNRLAMDHFRQEWEVLAKINHTNIVDIYDIGEMEDDGQFKPFFVMPMLPGKTLEQLISEQTLTVERTVEILSQVCRGLQAAHEQGVIHRDLKPSNIFVIDDAGSVKIIDFGIAHLTDNTASVGIKGTLLYMSPEQIQMKPLGAQSDVFSLAVVSYEALAQRRPFEGGATEEIAYRILNHVPPPVSDFNPEVGASLSQVIHAAMAKQSWHRFATAREFGEALQKAIHNKPIERFDPKRVEPRIRKAQKAFETSQYDFSAEMLGELEAEGHLQPEIRQLRRQIDHALKERNIRQTLDAARCCIDEEEYALARQKVQQLLDTTPGHPEALSLMALIEEKWTSQQVAEWLRLAREHLDNQSFLQARQAVQSVLGFRPADSQALQLLTEVSQVEEQVSRARRESAALFQVARDAFAKGDISGALSKVEKVLDYDRQVPDKSSPELAAAHQHFYNEVRSEHEAIRNAIGEIRRMLSGKDFKAAYAVCDRFLARYPADAQFRALRIDIDQKERQHLSACIARIDREVDAEPDLNRRVAILQQAVADWPREEHFKKALQAGTELRDLVSAIVEKARNLEAAGHFTEACNQWETLRAIHALYPNIDTETERLAKRRDEQASKEARARWLSQAARFLELGNYPEAIRLAEAGLTQFPDDPELQGMARMAEERRQRSAEIDRLIAEGYGLVTRGEYDPGLALLSRAYDMDKRNAGARSVLVDSLVKRAAALQDSDSFRAQEALDRALSVDPSHAVARSMKSMLLEKRKDLATAQSLGRAHELIEHGDKKGPRNEVTSPLNSYPEEEGLTKFLAAVEKEAVAAAPPPPPPAAPAPAAPLAARPDDNTRVFVPNLPDALKAEAEKFVKPAPPRPPIDPSRWKVGALIGCLVAAIGVLAWVAAGRFFGPPPPKARLVTLEVRPSIPAARIFQDGRPVDDTVLKLVPRDQEYVIEARLAGYKTKPEKVKVTSDTNTLTPLTLHLEPLPTRLILDTGMRATFNGQELVGQVELPAGAHTLELRSDGGSTFTLQVEAAAGRQPSFAVTASQIAFYCVVTTLEKDGQLEISPPLPKQVHMDDVPLEPVAPKMPLSELIPGEHALRINGGAQVKFMAGAEPYILVHAIPIGNIGGLTLSVVDDGAIVSLSGPSQTKPQEVKDRKAVFSNLRPGAYSLEITKDGFEVLKDSIQIQKGQNATGKSYALIPLKMPPTLVITGAIPNTEVSIDNTVVGIVDASGQLRKPNVPTGRLTFRLRHHLYDSKTFPRDVSAGDQVKLTPDELAMVKVLGIQVQNQIQGSTFRYRLKGTSETQETTDALLRVKRPGLYEVDRMIAGVRRGHKEISVTDSVVATQIPVNDEPEKPVVDPTQVRTLDNFEPPQTNRDKEGWTNAKNARMAGRVESGQFNFKVQFPRGGISLIKKSAKWSVSVPGGKCLEFELVSDKFSAGDCGKELKALTANRPGKSTSYSVQLTVRGNNITHEIAGDSGPASHQQDTRALQGSGAVEFRFREASVKDFRFSGRLAQ